MRMSCVLQWRDSGCVQQHSMEIEACSGACSSGGGCGSGELPQVVEKSASQSSKTCTKCKIAPAIACTRKDVVCGSCIYEQAFGGFYRAVCSSKCNTPWNKILLALSGGPSSTLALHNVHRCVVTNKKRMCFQVQVVHIDEGSYLGFSEDERTRLNAKIADLVSPYMLPLEVVPIESLFVDGSEDADLSSAASKLQLLLDECNSLDAKEDAVRLLREEVLQRTAIRLGCNWIIQGDNATRLSTQIIMDVCRGRGFSLPLRIAAFCRLPADGVGVMKPLRDCLADEVALALRSQRLEPVTIPSLATLTPLKGSISRLSEGFVAGLQDRKRTTVHTLLRSVEKLSCGSSVEAVEVSPPFVPNPHPKPKLQMRPVRDPCPAGAEGASVSSPPTAPAAAVCPLCHCPWHGIQSVEAASSPRTCPSCSALLRPLSQDCRDALTTVRPSRARGGAVLRSDVASFLLSDDESV